MYSRVHTLQVVDIRDSRDRRSSALALLLAGLGSLLLLGASALALQSKFASWGYVKAAGQVQRIVTAERGGRSAPLVVFHDALGKTHTILIPQVPQALDYKAGDAVDVLYDPRDTSQVRLTGFSQTYAFPLLLAAAGSLLLLAAAAMTEPPESLRALRSDKADADPDTSRLQYHPFNAVAATHYLAEAGLPESARKVKITDAAQAFTQGRIPVGLAEYLAYVSALAYVPGAAAYLAKHCPRVSHPAVFEAGSTRALVFMFERHAVLAICETDSDRLSAQLGQLFSRRAGESTFVPEDAVWDAAPRNAAAAEAWDGLRASIEAWVKEVAPDPAAFDDERVKTPFLLTGHGLAGTIAVLAAYDFAKRGRNVAAVVTFGARGAGGAAFAEDYRDLGLESRTLSVTAPHASLPLWRWPLAAPPPGLRWQLPASPAKATTAAPKKGTLPQKLAHRLLAREEAQGLKQRRGVFRAAYARLLAASSATRTAMLRHDIERRYALPLTEMMAVRLAQLLNGEREAADLAKALSEHLLDIRGVRPQDAHEVFLTLDGLPGDAPALDSPHLAARPASQ